MKQMRRVTKIASEILSLQRLKKKSGPHKEAVGPWRKVSTEKWRDRGWKHLESNIGVKLREIGRRFKG